MNTSTPTASQVAAEAEFQLGVAKNFATWMEALSRAIENAVTHDDGIHVAKLAEVAKYLACEAQPGFESAISNFAAIAEADSAPQNAINENVARMFESAPSISERIKLARESACLTQAGLAEACGVSQVNICKLETGESSRTSYLPEIARACGVSTDWLAFGSDSTGLEVQP
ncbi:helix-turn-helix domain-containing protein [Pseudomonas helleri]|uniref:helix-turn-helix domain-containing protein n=1 Tax=Pseudomonas helleri TaxID=1608996 RepID=UPI003FD45ABB